MSDGEATNSASANAEAEEAENVAEPVDYENRYSETYELATLRASPEFAMIAHFLLVFHST